ncbi:helix-turn-helix domain-containing protein [Enterococcus silesiacus]|uniref:helix-turn-helix domain-containing protein n=1 Tax=Enterococcus silesiacus TaxID=332949 RepID=UPI001FE4CD6B|nr:helix-turn-helix domain-containing protein [Enterococcus silesiacus]
MDDIYDRRINVLSYIDNQRREVSLAEIAKATNLSKKTVSMIIKQFEQELDVSKEQFEVYYINQTIQGVYANNLDIVSISNNQLKHSILYKMIKHIFLMEKIDAITFCDIEFISPATFSRHRRKLQKILNQCDLSLTRTNEIRGDELRIRNFFFLFFSNASNIWAFDQEVYKEMEEYFGERIAGWENMNCIRKRQICLLLYICIVRISQKKVMKKSILTVLSERFQDGIYTKVFFEYFHLKKNRPEQQSWDETGAALLLLYKERLVDGEGFVIEAHQNFFNEENFKLVKYSHILAEKLIETFFQGSSTPPLYWKLRKELDMMHLLMETCFIDPKLFYYVYDEKNFFYADPTEKKIQKNIQTVIEELITKTEYGSFFKSIKKNTSQETLTDYVYLVTYTILVKFMHVELPKVRILIQNSKVFVGPIISQKIELLFSDKIEFVQNQLSSPDIIVTDTELTEKSDKAKEIFISSFSNSSDLDLLLEEIVKKIVEHYDDRHLYLS